MEGVVAAPIAEAAASPRRASAPYDVTIIGGGIVGLSTGLALLTRFPRARLLILEKERDWALHQTGHNSGVIHSGIYYAPGSHKAVFAKAGNAALVRFCRQHDIPFDVCGKVIVASDPAELPLLDRLYHRGLENGLAVERLTGEELREIEPHCAGLAALRVPSTGIVDYRRVAAAFAGEVQRAGGELRLASKVEQVAPDGRGVTIETGWESFRTQFLVNCAGLQCDRIARLLGVRTGMRIVPVRGEYFKLKPDKRGLVRHLIYPVPNPRYPFLGVHFTRLINGDVHAGPNAVLSFKREAYGRAGFDLRDAIDMVRCSAFWRFAAQNWQEGTKEWARSLSKARFARSLQKLVPEVQADDLIEPHAGVRAQALTDDGRLVDDFLFVRGPQSLHVCNAPSPAATASIPIGHAIVEQIARQATLP